MDGYSLSGQLPLTKASVIGGELDPREPRQPTFKDSAWELAADSACATFSVMLTVTWLPFCRAASRRVTCCSAVWAAACSSGKRRQQRHSI